MRDFEEFDSIDSFYMSVDMGDLIYSLLFCKILSVYKIYIDANNDDVKLNKASVDFLLPLIQYQKHIKEATHYSDQWFDVNYGIHPQNDPVVVGTNLTQYHASKFGIDPEDKRLYESWLDVPMEDDSNVKEKKILINRTDRYHGDASFYNSFLRYVHPKYLLFAGLESEHKSFCSQFGIDIDFVKTETSMELAAIINTVPTFLGNESLVCAIATGLGKNCYIEYGRAAANYIFNKQNIIYF